jgi:Contractile injection system spike tip protein
MRGSLKITGLASDQTAQKLTVGGKKVIPVGSKFDATLTVITKAKTSSLPVQSDQTASYSGKGSFTTSDTKLESA